MLIDYAGHSLNGPWQTAESIVCVIRSSSGIGRVRVRVFNPEQRKRVVLRFMLQGLESATLDNGRVCLALQVCIVVCLRICCIVMTHRTHARARSVNHTGSVSFCKSSATWTPP